MSVGLCPDCRGETALAASRNAISGHMARGTICTGSGKQPLAGGEPALVSLPHGVPTTPNMLAVDARTRSDRPAPVLRAESTKSPEEAAQKSSADWRTGMGVVAVLGWSLYGLVSCISGGDSETPQHSASVERAYDNSATTAVQNESVESWAGGSDTAYMAAARSDARLDAMDDSPLLWLGHAACRNAEIDEFGWSDSYEMLSDPNGTLTPTQASVIVGAAKSDLCPAV
jgi:hypothetical protein